MNGRHRAWWQPHLLTLVACILLLASLAALNIPLDAWADAMTGTFGMSGSSEWIGWPEPCYHVELELEQNDFAKMSVTEFDIASMSYDGAIAFILVIGNAFALEMLTRRLSHLPRFSLATTLAFITTLASYAGLHSGWPSWLAVHQLVGLVQQIANLLVLVSILVCWYAAFQFAAMKLVRRPTAVR